MNGPPLVSVVTPSYNQGRFLRRTIASVLGQSYPHVEYLVIDGGSTDDSVAILKSYGDRLAWVSEPDRGQAHALNKGFARARGDVLAYLNSDDVLAPGAVEKAVVHLLAHPDWDLVYGRANYIDEGGRIVGAYPTAPFTFRRLVEDNCVCQPAAFWRARLARRVGPFDEALDCCMDYDYWLRAARAGLRLEYVEDLLASSRLHPRAKTACRRLRMYQESIAVCARHAGRVPRGHRVGLRRELCRGRPAWLARLPSLAAALALVSRGGTSGTERAKGARHGATAAG
jgi:glycosyltransferase involved in cell wall biosynthesis